MHANSNPPTHTSRLCPHFPLTATPWPSLVPTWGGPVHPEQTDCGIRPKTNWTDDPSIPGYFKQDLEWGDPGHARVGPVDSLPCREEQGAGGRSKQTL